jgi:hypothetical protein
MQQGLSVMRWRAELAGARTGLWLLGRLSGPVEVSADLNRFFVDRYLRLAKHHRARGRHDRARDCLAKAVLHWRATTLDDPPPAEAAVMPVPLPPILTWAVTGRPCPTLRRAA